MHSCDPFFQRPLDTASLHPELRLKAQQIGMLLAFNCLNPLSSWGHIDFALGEGLAFFFGFGRGGVGLGGASTSSAGSLVTLTVEGRGSKNMFTLGSHAKACIMVSMGFSPRAFGFREPVISCDNKVNMCLSALITCSILTFPYPGGASLVMLVRSVWTHLSCTAYVNNWHWSIARPRCCSAHWSWGSFDVSTLIFCSAVAILTVCCSTTKVCGFSLIDPWTSESRLEHFDGGIQMIAPESAMEAAKSKSAYDGWSSPFISKPVSLPFWSSNLATFSAWGNFFGASLTGSFVIWLFKWATTKVCASKCNLRDLARAATLRSTPPLRTLLNCLNSSSEHGCCMLLWCSYPES